MLEMLLANRNWGENSKKDAAGWVVSFSNSISAGYLDQLIYNPGYTEHLHDILNITVVE